MSLKKKYFLFVTLTIILLGVSLLVFVWRTLSRHLMDDLKKRGVFLARQIAAGSVNDLLTDKRVDLQRRLDYYRRENKDISFIYIVSPQGEVLSSTSKKDLPSHLRNFNIIAGEQDHQIHHLVTEEGHILDVVVPILQGQGGFLHLGFIEARLEKHFSSVIYLIIAIIVLAMLIGFLLLIWLFSLIAKPIAELTKVILEVSGGNLDVEARIDSDDELGHLGAAINKMNHDLQLTTVSYDYMESIVNTMNNALIVLDEQGLIEKVNQATTALLLYSEQELLGQSLRLVLKPELNSQIPDFLIWVMSKSLQNVELECLSKDGHKIAVLFSSTIIYADKERIQRIVCVLQDISERKSIEGEVARNYEFQILLNNLFQTALQNKTLNEMLKRFIQEITAIPWLGLEDKGAIFLVKDAPQILHLAAIQNIAAPLQQKCAQVPFGYCLCGRAAQSGKTIFTKHVDERHEISYEGMEPHGHYCVPIKGSKDKKVLGVLCLYLKAGARLHELEESFLFQAVANVLTTIIVGKQAEEELRKEHIRSARLLTSLSSALIGIENDNLVFQWNAAAEKTFGIPAAQVMGKSFPECGVKWNWAEVMQALYTSIDSEQPVTLTNLQVEDAAGKNHILNLTITSIRDEEGKYSEFLLLGVDVTEYKQLEAQLVQSQKLESIGQLAAGIAHEINTPMQYVGDNTHFLQDSFQGLSKLLSAYANLLAEAKAGGDVGSRMAAVESLITEVDMEFLTTEIPQAISQSLLGIERVSKIVRAMKEFSHPDSGEKTQVDINHAIENTITVARNEWKYVADVVTDFAPDLPLVPCLAGEFNQVILNLVVNAAQAIGEMMGETSPDKGTITISTRKVEPWVEIRIMDTGGGIPEKVRSRVFDPFFTTKEVGKGTGQGLALARSVIMDKHGGTITFETIAGEGTTFIIRLPLQDKEAKDSESEKL